MHPRHRKRYEVQRHARYLTFSCYGRLPLFKNDAIKHEFVEHLAAVREKLKYRLLAWVIMPEHVHLLLVPDLPECPVSVILRSLKQAFAQRIVNRWVELNAPVLARITDTRGIRRFWQRGGGYDRNIFSYEELGEKIMYIHNNPVRRGLVDRADEWSWSSYHWYSGVREGVLPIDGW